MAAKRRLKRQPRPPRKWNVGRQPDGRVRPPPRDLGSAGTQAIRAQLDERGIRMEKAVLVLDLLAEIGRKQNKPLIDGRQHSAGERYRQLWRAVMPCGPKGAGKPGEGVHGLLDDERLVKLQREMRDMEHGLTYRELEAVQRVVIYNKAPYVYELRGNRIKLIWWAALQAGLHKMADTREGARRAA